MLLALRFWEQSLPLPNQPGSSIPGGYSSGGHIPLETPKPSPFLLLPAHAYFKPKKPKRGARIDFATAYSLYALGVIDEDELAALVAYGGVPASFTN